MSVIQQQPITHARRKLMDLLDRRLLRPFCEYKAIDYHYTYRVATGKKKPPVKYIWALRDKIHPAEWFYGEDEPYEPLQFKIRHLHEDVEKTVAMIDFKKYVYTDLIQLSNEYNIKFFRLYNVHSGKYAPSFTVIQDMMVLYKPELWFIYPDELEKKFDTANNFSRKGR